MVGCGHGLIDVLGLAELQPLERSENGILVPDNIFWRSKVLLHILMICSYHMCGGEVGRHCNLDRIHAIPIYNN